MESPKLDLDQIRALVAIVSGADISELAVESPTLKVSIKKGPGTQEGAPATSVIVPIPANALAPRASATAAPSTAAPQTWPHPPSVSSAEAAEAAESNLDHLTPITAPMVGTFYRAASPEAPPFINEGDTVDHGQTVCVIEAMKLFNEIQSDHAGRVVRVLVENGVPVEYGQPLFLLEPHAP